MPNESGNISDKVDNATERIQSVADVLDDIANLLNEGLHAVADRAATQMESNPLGTLLNGFISRMTSPPNYGEKPQEWEILPPDETQTEKAETIIDGNSPISTDSERNE